MHLQERLHCSNRFCNIFTEVVGCSNRHCKRVFRGGLHNATATDDSFSGAGFSSQPPLKSRFQCQLNNRCYKDLNFSNGGTVAVIKTGPESLI